MSVTSCCPSQPAASSQQPAMTHLPPKPISRFFRLALRTTVLYLNEFLAIVGVRANTQRPVWRSGSQAVLNINVTAQ